VADNRKFLIVGLGNSEAKYEGTRHNIGFEVVAALAKNLEASFSQDRFAYTARARHKGKQIIMILPTTFMNLSGKAVRYWLDSENIEIENMIVITDDIDLPIGTIRIKSKGSGGSHNGLNHIIETLGHQNFPRLRFGIGKDYPKGFQVDYVLGRFSKEDLEVVNPEIERCTEAIYSFVSNGIAQTMNHFNTNPSINNKEEFYEKP